ncbi:MAG: RluA family pseudouridine synthase [bacterium]|nr:RluA family pseudouridine synthase [bacterium]
MDKLPVIFEDTDLVVVDKPSGLVVDTVESQTGTTLVHRLDKDTSGVMILAKTPGAVENLRKQFEERQIQKKYLALVYGAPKTDQGLITTPLRRWPKDPLRSAITEWKIIQKYSRDGQAFTLLELAPHTGRTHQLRQHLKSIGFPIVADPLYGYRKKVKTDLTWCPRLFLHAQEITFTHPGTGERTTLTSPLPADLQTVLDQNLVH